ncbi:MAG TPA: prepilin-type N-terminal cleavage/methylation domain-containing protein [Methyloversatilis sp.]
MNKSQHAQRGVSLVEVLITLAIGLIISVGAIAMVISNRQSYRSTEALSRIQESTRVAFEIMSRDLRASGVNACNGGRRVLNLLASPTTNWWSDWTGGIRGFDNTTASLAATIGTGTQQRVSGTDLVELMHAGTSALVVRVHNASAAAADLDDLNVPAHGLVVEQSHSVGAGDLVLVCDFEDTTIFQVSGVDSTTHAIEHDVVSGKTPGNCSSGLAFRTPLVCDGGAGSRKVFPPGAQLMRLEAAAWYVGYNGRSGNTNSPTSLYRVGVERTSGGSAQPVVEEIVEGVRDMQIRYMVSGTYVTAASVTDWTQVTGAEITLTIDAPDAGTSTASSSARLSRTLTHVVNLRNRVS